MKGPRNSLALGSIAALLSAASLLGGMIAVNPAKDYPVRPVPFTAVHFNDVFWAPRIETNRKVTIPFAFEKCEQTGRVDNFERAAKALRGETLTNKKAPGYPFDDTDVYKVIEGASYRTQLCSRTRSSTLTWTASLPKSPRPRKKTVISTRRAPSIRSTRIPGLASSAGNLRKSTATNSTIWVTCTRPPWLITRRRASEHCSTLP